MSDPFASLSIESVEALAALGVVDAEAGLTGSLQRLVETAQQLLPGTLAVSVTARSEGEVFTAVSSEQIALDLDERQYDAGAGPCTDAMDTGVTVHSPDLTTEARWPGWTPQAVAAGVSSMRSAALPGSGGRHLGALNCYGSSVEVYASPGIARLADLLGTSASTQLENLLTVSASRDLAGQLREAMESRVTIEQAKGVLISRLGVIADLAFDYLVKLSQGSHRKLHDVAGASRKVPVADPGPTQLTRGRVAPRAALFKCSRLGSKRIAVDATPEGGPGHRDTFSGLPVRCRSRTFTHDRND